MSGSPMYGTPPSYLPSVLSFIQNYRNPYMSPYGFGYQPYSFSAPSLPQYQGQPFQQQTPQLPAYQPLGQNVIGTSSPINVAPPPPVPSYTPPPPPAPYTPPAPVQQTYEQPQYSYPGDGRNWDLSFG